MHKTAATILSLAFLSFGASRASAEEPAPSPVAVKHALESLLPVGVVLKSVKVDGQHASVDAASQNQQQVSDFLRRVDTSTAFHGVNLVTMQKSVGGATTFTLSMDVRCPRPGEHGASNPCDGSAPAATTVFKCTVNGATAYQSMPCAGTPRK